MSAHILVVDDEPMIRQLIRQLLLLDGFSVTEAENGVEAITLAKEHRPDLILLDYMMPKMDGLAACREIRSDPDMAQVPIIMLSANAQPTVAERCMEAGVNRFLDKRGNVATGLTQHVRELLA